MSKLKSRFAAKSAKVLRGRMTDAEIGLWHHLRNGNFFGFKFVRQHPVGPYIADFACREADLIIELDGGQHAMSATDAARTKVLEQHGYCVLRFWNNEVLTNTDGVLLAIKSALETAAKNRSRWSVEENGPWPIQGETS
ncbi:endonuclease domain-containing protein [Pelagibacterium sp.]|uniref:endonuclease domain-containing protein n=1 Tax=Pelagibacterium sp. TaxID=1967288 RepID=UPI003BAA37C1